MPNAYVYIRLDWIKHGLLSCSEYHIIRCVESMVKWRMYEGALRMEDTSWDANSASPDNLVIIMTTQIMSKHITSNSSIFTRWIRCPPAFSLIAISNASWTRKNPPIILQRYFGTAILRRQGFQWLELSNSPRDVYIIPTNSHSFARCTLPCCPTWSSSNRTYSTYKSESVIYKV